MAWKIKYSQQASKALKKMDQTNAKRIVNFLDYRISPLENPKKLGKSLKGDLSFFWRFRVGEFRVLCDIQDDKLIVLATTIGHRKNIYKKKTNNLKQKKVLTI